MPEIANKFEKLMEQASDLLKKTENDFFNVRITKEQFANDLNKVEEFIKQARAEQELNKNIWSNEVKTRSVHYMNHLNSKFTVAKGCLCKED